MSARTLAETDQLLDLLNTARRERDEAIAEREAWMVSSRTHGTKLRETQSHALHHIEQLAAVRQDLAISKAANAALREALRIAKLERENAVTLQQAAETDAAWARAENERLSAALASALEDEPAPFQPWWRRWLP